MIRLKLHKEAVHEGRKPFSFTKCDAAFTYKDIQLFMISSRLFSDIFVPNNIALIKIYLPISMLMSNNNNSE